MASRLDYLASSRRYRPVDVLSEGIKREQQYEGMDDFVDNHLYHSTEHHCSRLKWPTMILLTGVIGLSIGVAVFLITYLAHFLLKYNIALAVYVGDQCSCQWAPMMVYVTTSTLLFVGSSLLLLACAPNRGSGLAELKCNLNGVDNPGLLSKKTLIAKLLATVLAAGSGSTGDVFEPMIHVGGALGYQISSISSFFKRQPEVRSFVSAGVSAAWGVTFGSPIGGLLYSVEEGSSFWSGPLSALVFFCIGAALFIFNCFRNGLQTPAEDWGYWSRPGCLDVGLTECCSVDYPFKVYTLPLYVLLGVFGGIYGGLVNLANKAINILRYRYFTGVGWRIAEVFFIGLLTSAVSFGIPYFWSNCLTVPPQNQLDYYNVQISSLNCDEGQYNPFSTLLLQNKSQAARSVETLMLHWDWAILLLCAILLTLIPAWSFGSGLPTGIIGPSILAGAMYGRIIGHFLKYYTALDVRVSDWALLGAAATTSGVTRLSITLVCLFLEASDWIYVALPMMIVVYISRWVAGLFAGGCYSNFIHANKIPLLDKFSLFAVPELRASQIMCSPVITLPSFPTVRAVIGVLTDGMHNGFPVIDSKGRLLGLILRSQLIVLLHQRSFAPDRKSASTLVCVDEKHFRYSLTHPQLDAIIDSEDMENVLNLRPYMNLNPMKAALSCPVSRIFRLFRTIGLRHFVIVDDENGVQGIVTRKDISKHSAIFKLTRQSQRTAVRQLHDLTASEEQ